LLSLLDAFFALLFNKLVGAVNFVLKLLVEVNDCGIFMFLLLEDFMFFIDLLSELFYFLSVALPFINEHLFLLLVLVVIMEDSLDFAEQVSNFSFKIFLISLKKVSLHLTVCTLIFLLQ